jgi:hypothetical protein
MGPKELVRGPFLARDFLLNTLLAIGAVVLLGLRLPPLEYLAPSQGVASLNPSGGGALYVLTAVWLDRAFLLSPFWRSREKKIE